MKTKTMKNLRLPSFKYFTPLVCIAGIALMLIPASSGRAQGSSALSNVLAQLSSTTQSTADPTLESLGSELVAKSQSLNTSLAGNPGTQSDLTGALQSLLGNKGSEAVAGFQKLSAAKLTPEQTSLAKDIAHTGSAFLVQKNLGALDGSQSDVATIVSSLHAGNYTAALPAIKKVSQNVNITPAQKDLLASVTSKFVPGAGKLGDSLSGGLKSLPGFGH
jgi:hypothetical protein